jgi:hypothetical protein
VIESKAELEHGAGVEAEKYIGIMGSSGRHEEGLSLTNSITDICYDHTSCRVVSEQMAQQSCRPVSKTQEQWQVERSIY